MRQPPESKPPVRRPRKTPEQRGAVGWWAYHTMDILGLTDDQIAKRVGVGSAAIRKFQGSPKGELGAESRAKLLAYYRETATLKKIPIDEPPAGFIMAGRQVFDTPVVPAAYLERIDNLVEQLALDRAAWAQDRKLILRLVAALQPSEYAAADQEAAALGLGSLDREALGGGPAGEPPEDAHPASNHPGR